MEKCERNLFQLEFVILDFLRPVVIFGYKLNGLYFVIRHVLLLNLLVYFKKDNPD